MLKSRVARMITPQYPLSSSMLLRLPSFVFIIQPILIMSVDPPESDDYIRSSCNATLYTDLCYTALSPFASTIQKDPARLARIAVGVSFSRARALASHLHQSSGGGDMDPRTATAFQDCLSNLGDAVDQMHESLNQLSQLHGSLELFRFQVSNVQTWMSAALTNEETCTDGLEGVVDGPLKADVSQCLPDVKKLTSIALALVNNYADTVD